MKDCKSKGLVVAYPRDVDDWEEMKNALTKNNIWLGYHFKDGKSMINEAGKKQRFFSWNDGEPNNYGGNGKYSLFLQFELQ